MDTEYGQETSRALQPYSKSTSLTEEQAKHIITTVWPGAPLVEVVKAAILCKDYGLNPLMKHLFLVPFKNRTTKVISWATILGINATRTLARRANQFGYSDGPRVMTEQEQKDILGQVDGQLWAITVVIDRYGLKAPGYGSWPADKGVHGDDKGNTPLNMAMVRSERAALLRLCPAEMAGAISEVEVMDERHIELVQEPQSPLPEQEPPKPAPKPQLIQPPEKPQASNGQDILSQIKAESERLGIDPREAYNNRFPDALPTLADIQAYLQELKETPIDEGVPHEITSWAEFWAKAKRITGKAESEIPGMLGVKVMHKWTGTLDEALEELKK